jgi:O-antigen ligase
MLKLLWLTPAGLLVVLFALFAGIGSLIGMAAIISVIALTFLIILGPRFLTILLLVGVPTVFVFPNTVLQNVPVLNTERLLFIGIVGLLLLPPIFKTGIRYRLIQPEKFGIAFLGVAVASYILAIVLGNFPPDPIQDGYFFIQYIMGLSAFMIARRLEWHEKSVMQLIDIMLVVGLFMSGQAFLQYFLGIDIFVPSFLEVPHADEGRVTGTFANASEYGAVATCILLLGIYRLGSTRDALARFFVLIVLAAIGIAIILSKTRAPWLAGIVAIGMVGIADSRVRLTLISLATFGLSIGVALFPIFLDITEFQERLTSLAPIAERLAIWVAAISMGINNPILGIGFGPDAFSAALPQYAMDFFGISANWVSGVGIPHNEFFHIFSLTGILGIYLYLAILVSITRLLLQSYREKHDRSVIAGLLPLYSLAMLANLVVNSLFVDTGPFWYLVFFVFFFLGVSVSLVEKERSGSVVKNVN